MPEWSKAHQQALTKIVADMQTIGAVFTALSNAREMQLYTGDFNLISEQYDLIITFLGWKDKTNAVINEREAFLVTKIQSIVRK